MHRLNDFINDLTVAPSHYRVSLLHRDDDEFDQQQSYIRDSYQHCYQATITQCMPLLLSLQERNFASQAVLGLRSAADQPLFLEQYLDSSIESAIAAAATVPVLREQIIEIGNLAAQRRIGSQRLFIIMTAALASAGFNWMTFTATPQVVKLVARLGFRPLDLGVADPTRLADRGSSWGSYFATAPRLQAGSLSEAMTALIANPLVAAQLLAERSTIERLARELEHYRLNVSRGR